MVSFDVISLFTNIPLDETISICADFLYRGPSVAPLPFPEAVFIELMGIGTKLVSFSLMRICFAKLRAFVWDPLWDPFWRILLLGSMKDVCLISFLSPLPVCDMLMILLFPSNLVAMPWNFLTH